MARPFRGIEVVVIGRTLPRAASRTSFADSAGRSIAAAAAVADQDAAKPVLDHHLKLGSCHYCY